MYKYIYIYVCAWPYNEPHVPSFSVRLKKAVQALPKLFSSHFTYHLDHTPELLNQS